MPGFSAMIAPWSTKPFIPTKPIKCDPIFKKKSCLGKDQCPTQSVGGGTQILKFSLVGMGGRGNYFSASGEACLVGDIYRTCFSWYDNCFQNFIALYDISLYSPIIIVGSVSIVCISSLYVLYC